MTDETDSGRSGGPLVDGEPQTPVVRAGQCTATASKTGQRCRRQALRGATVCIMHGASAPQVRAAAARRVQEREAEKVLGKIWRPDAVPVDSPVAALSLLAGQLRHAVDALGERVESTELDGPTATAWARVVRELRQVLTDMSRLEVGAKLMQLEAAQVRLLASAYQSAMTALQSEGVVLHPAMQELATRAFMAELRRGNEPGVVAGVIESG